MIPSNRTEFRDYCLRKLGKGVIEINIDPDQIEDRIDEALDFWRNFHHDAVERIYLQHQITSTDITNKYIDANNELIMGVTRIFPANGTSGSGKINMFDLRYQIRLNDFSSFYVASNSHLDYYLIRRQLEQIDMFYVGEAGMEFNKISNRIYMYWDWDRVIEGEYLIMECQVALDPASYARIWSDRMLQRYTIALLKQQWAQNMSKFQNVQLLGGIMMNGQEMFNQATDEIEKLEEQIRETFQEPPRFIVG